MNAPTNLKLFRRETPMERFIQAVSEGKDLADLRMNLTENESFDWIDRMCVILNMNASADERIGLLHELRDTYAQIAFTAQEEAAEQVPEMWRRA